MRLSIGDAHFDAYNRHGNYWSLFQHLLQRAKVFSSSHSACTHIKAAPQWRKETFRNDTAHSLIAQFHFRIALWRHRLTHATNAAILTLTARLLPMPVIESAADRVFFHELK